MQRPEISFEYYFNEYCGKGQGILDKAAFDRYIVSAWREIQGCVGNAQKGDMSQPAVLHCVCEVAEQLFRRDKVGSVKSETVDGYSVTYSDRKDVGAEIYRIIRSRLADTGLLYAGVE